MRNTDLAQKLAGYLAANPRLGIRFLALVALSTLSLLPSPGRAEEAALARSSAAAELAQRCDVIFVGRLVDRQSFQSEDGRFIKTRYVFSVEQSVSGADASTVEIVELGGTVDGVTLEVSHGISYGLSQAYLIFAEKDESGEFRTAGGLDGRLAVVEDSAGRRLLRLRPGHPLLGPEVAGQFLELNEAVSRIAAFRKGGLR